MTSEATKMFKLNLMRHLEQNPDVDPSPLGKKAGRSDSYIRTLLKNDDQSPRIDTAELIAKEIGMELHQMLTDPKDWDPVDEFSKLFRGLSQRDREWILAMMTTDRPVSGEQDT